MEIILTLLLAFAVWELVGIGKRLRRIEGLLDQYMSRYGMRPPYDDRFR